MKNIVIFAGDLADVAQQRRIMAFQSLGHAVHVVGFRKSDDPIVGIGDVFDLGQIPNQHLFGRLRKICRMIPRTLKHLRQLENIDLFYARNMDMLFFAWIMRVLMWSRAQIFYEVLDIHGVFTNGGIKQILARGLERFLLRYVARVIVSSPDFITQYFTKVQQFSGDWALLENKIWQGTVSKVRPVYKDNRNVKLRIGWVGNIRCQPSFEILMKLADQMQDVEIHIHGIVHKHALHHFDHHVAARSNVIFHGAYEYPSGLSDVYRDIDLVWAQDLWQTGANSNWLLPNRLYEAAWHGCPSICMTATATARRVAALDIGYVIPDATELQALLHTLTHDDIQSKRQQMLNADPALFCMTPAEVENAISLKPNTPDRLPDFICVGAMRAGTTTLYDYCAQHPEIGVSRIKETDYFIKSKNFDRGIGWYKAQFPSDAKICGEFSPNYSKASVFPDVPKRMHSVLPNAKIIYIVRHPVDRAISQYNHSYLSGQNPPDVNHLLGSHEWEHLIDTSSYNRQLNLYLNHYHASQLLVLNLDDLKRDPMQTLTRVSHFLGVRDDWSVGNTLVENSSISLAALPKSVLRIGEMPVVTTLKNYVPYRLKQWVKRLLERKEIRIPPTFSDTIKRALWVDMYPDIQEFTEMTGIEFSPPRATDPANEKPPQGGIGKVVNATG
jgi:succinoglycan biosynthesis protein ExoL